MDDGVHVYIPNSEYIRPLHHGESALLDGEKSTADRSQRRVDDGGLCLLHIAKEHRRPRSDVRRKERLLLLERERAPERAVDEATAKLAMVAAQASGALEIMRGWGRRQEPRQQAVTSRPEHILRRNVWARFDQPGRPRHRMLPPTQSSMPRDPPARRLR